VQPGAAGEAAATEQGEGARRERRHGRRDRHEFRKPHSDAPAEAAAAEGAAGRESRDDKGGRPRERFEGKGRGEDRNKGKFRGERDHGGREGGGRDRSGRDKRDRDKGGRESGPSHRQYATSASPRDRERAIDPNSPFAKLAALKEQLAANRKD